MKKHTDIEEIYSYIDGLEDRMLSLWKHLVCIESHSMDIEGVKNIAAHLDTYCNAMGFNTKKYMFENAGPSLVVFNEEKDLSPIILMAHMDTVHKKGSFKELFRKDGEYIYGPGVYDCKGGIVIALFVMNALIYAGYDKRQIKVILSGDEEVAHSLSNGKGSEIYSEEATGAVAAFNCESGLLNGNVITARKGGIVVKVTVKGIASHAGNNPQAGASAIKEAAKKIIEIENMTDYEGIMYNCGEIYGGTGSNVIPDTCSFIVGIRFSKNVDYDEAIDRIKKICMNNYDARTSTEVEVQTVFRAMEKNKDTAELLKIYQDASEQLGFDRPEGIFSGGCSDGAYVAMAGVPVICGVGVRGQDNHSLKEKAVEKSIVEQVKKIVTTIINIPDDFHLTD